MFSQSNVTNEKFLKVFNFEHFETKINIQKTFNAYYTRNGVCKVAR